MVVVQETEPDVYFSTSVFVDDYQLIDSALLESKLGDTCTVGGAKQIKMLILT